MTTAREVGRGDRAGILDVLRDAFETGDEARLVEKMWADNSIVAEKLIENNGNVAAYAAITPVDIRVNDQPYAASLGLAPVAVSQTHQRQGLGTITIDAVIAAAFEKYPDQLLFVLGEPSYYQRFGFMPAAQLGYLWEGGDVGDAFQVRSLEGVVQPVKSSDYTSHNPHPARVHYCDAFQIFSEATE